MQQIDINQVQSHLPEILEAALDGQEIVITKDDESLLKITRVQAIRSKRILGQATGKITLTDDFNDSYEFNEELP